MDILRKDDIRKLLENNNYPSVSIFIPTHKEWNGMNQDKTRYRNLLNKTEKNLSEFMREKELNKYLKQAKELLNDSEFWNHQENGLAVYFNKDEFNTYRLPIPVEEFLFINNIYYIKPLLPVLNGDGRFFLISFDQKETRLFECTKYKIKQLIIPDTMVSLDEMLEFYEIEKSLQFRSGIRQPGKGGRKQGAVFHGQGGGTDEAEHKKRLLDFAHIINNGIHKLLKNETAPLIIAAVEYLIPIFKKANSYPYLYEKHLPLNSEEFSLEELHKKAYELIRPAFEEEEKKAFSKYEQFSGNGKATSNIEEIVQASLGNRIEYLWVNLDEHQWGTFNSAEQKIELDNESNQDNKDLLDFAAAQTLINNGTVYALKRNDMPVKKPALAVFRF
ncbi:MAG: hypothetical protein EHM47_06770 [Ignavibacteriales bacterium]|nr:MAG: hypothetical protein EHM47_06770 [Ignavibacteriales bacterium]